MDYTDEKIVCAANLVKGAGKKWLVTIFCVSIS